MEDKSINQLLHEIAVLRETKGKEGEVNSKLDDWVIRLLIEKALTQQHIFMGSGLKDKKALGNFEKTVLEMEKYADNFNLKIWTSRINRYKGRVKDYKRKYKEAVKYHQKALLTVKSDPDYLKGNPLELEYKAFLINSKMRSNLTKASVTEALKFYKSFEVLERAKKLKQTSYATWAIWRTGVLIRFLQCLLEKKSKLLSKEEMLGWIESGRHDLAVKTEVDFSYRLSEFSELEKKMKL